jgi:TRAP-type mannitol/chloroaromatic compound transport system permease small subunit
LTTERVQGRNRWLTALDRIVGLVCVCGLALVLPVSLLLFLQWPLRELVHAWSREANDLAQWLFALYASVAITYATHTRSHLAADALARRYSSAVRARLYRFASLLVMLPWSLFILYAVAPMAWQSALQLERFPETYNPGYFILKLAVVALALLVLLQAIVDVSRPEQH